MVLTKYGILLFAGLLFAGCGSRSSDFKTGEETENPLPPCPDKPNCVRISEAVPASIDTAWKSTLSVLEVMSPLNISRSAEDFQVEMVFRVFFFKDDMVVRLEETESSTTFLYIRSASRVGYSDLGVNRRRVEKFLRLLNDRIPS